MTQYSTKYTHIKCNIALFTHCKRLHFSQDIWIEIEKYLNSFVERRWKPYTEDVKPLYRSNLLEGQLFTSRLGRFLKPSRKKLQTLVSIPPEKGMSTEILSLMVIIHSKCLQCTTSICAYVCLSTHEAVYFYHTKINPCLKGICTTIIKWAIIHQNTLR